MPSTPEEQAAARKELARRELQARGLLEESGEPVPVDQPWYTGPLEAMSGWAKGTAAIPDMPTDLANTAITAAKLTNPWDEDGKVTEEELFKPLFGTREAYEEANPVTPGYESWRETGEVLGGSTSAGAVTGTALGGPVGGALGWLEGGRSGLFSLAGEKIGEGIDYFADNKDRRFETLGAIYGGLSPIVARPVSGLMTRAKYAGSRTPDIAKAAKAANIPPSVALLGNDAAKSVPTPGNVFKKQITGLEKLATKNKEAIRGNARPVGESVEEIGQRVQEKASAAAKGARGKISEKQERLTRAAGGEDAWHDPSGVLDFIKGELDSPRNADPKLRGQLEMIRDRYKGARRPEDPALHKQLLKDRDEAIAAQDDGAIASINDAIEANLSINETALRKITSDLKSEIQNESSPLYKYDIDPVAKAAEDIRATAADTNYSNDRVSRAHWDATQAETARLYPREEMLRKRAGEDIDPTADFDTASDVNYFLGTSGDKSPGRLEAIKENLPAGDEGLGGLLAAQYGMRTMPGGQLDMTGGKWWRDNLGPRAKALRTTDPATAANLETQALLTREMPQPPNQGLMSGLEELGGVAVKTAALGGNPLAMGVYPKINRMVTEGLRKGVGIDRAESMTRSNAEDIASLLARSVTEVPTQVAPTIERKKRPAFLTP